MLSKSMESDSVNQIRTASTNKGNMKELNDQNSICVISQMNRTESVQTVRKMLESNNDKKSSSMSSSNQQENNKVTLRTKYYTAEVKVKSIDEMENTEINKCECIIMLVNDNHSGLSFCQCKWNNLKTDDVVGLLIILHDVNLNEIELLKWGVKNNVEVITQQICQDEGYLCIDRRVTDAVHCVPWPTTSNIINEQRLDLMKVTSSLTTPWLATEGDGDGDGDGEWGEFCVADGDGKTVEATTAEFDVPDMEGWKKIVRNSNECNGFRKNNGNEKDITKTTRSGQCKDDDISRMVQVLMDFTDDDDDDDERLVT